MSTYKDNSELSRLNRNSSLDYVQISPMLAEVLATRARSPVPSALGWRCSPCGRTPCMKNIK
jgi:hypothetical protein